MLESVVLTMPAMVPSSDGGRVQNRQPGVRYESAATHEQPSLDISAHAVFGAASTNPTSSYKRTIKNLERT